MSDDAKRRAILLNGSPKPGGGTSGVLGGYLFERLGERGFEIETMSAVRTLRSSDEREKFLCSVEEADLLVVASPLYVDSLPYPVVGAMEMLRERLSKKETRKKQRIAAIVNSGFPEASQNDTALEICRCFAADAGFEWAGGLALGGGQSIGGIPLEKRGGFVRHLRTALDLAAEGLASGDAVPVEAERLFSKRLMPVWIYLTVGEYGWKRLARKHGSSNRMHDRPYRN